MQHIPQIYGDITPDLPGYDGLTFKVLQNPTGKQWQDWKIGDHKEHRAEYGRALCAFYGPTQIEGFDFSTPEAAVATMENIDVPDELLLWLVHVPTALWLQRRDLIEKNLYGSSATSAGS